MAIEKDLVLVYFEDNPLSFARIEKILPDAKPDWYHVTLLMLQIPLQVVTWILRDIYINGETFTMNGKKMRLELVESPEPVNENTEEDQNGEQKPAHQENASVISLKDFKK